MKKIKLLLLGIVSILGIGSSFASFSINGVYYEDGFYRNIDRGLITVISSGDIATLQDKNLGATVVYDPNSQSVTSSSIPVYNISSNDYRFWSCSQLGNFYQWGNNYGFDCATVFSGGYKDFPLVELTGTYTYENPLDFAGFYDVTVSHPGDNAWGGTGSSTVLTQQGPCSDGYYLPNETDYTNFIIMMNRFTFSDTMDLFNYLKIPYRYYWVTGMSSRVARQWSLMTSIFNIYFQYLQGYAQNNSLGFPGGWRSYFFAHGNYLPGDFRNVQLSPVRCFKNTPVLPDNTWVALSGGDTSLLPDPEPEYEPNPDMVSPIDGGIFDYNSYLLEQAILCYMSNGYTGNCEGINYTGFVDQYQHQNPWWSEDNQHGSLTFTEASSVLSNYCINNNIIQYPFCSQLDLYNDAWLTYFYDTGVLLYYILGSGFTVDLSDQGSGQLGPLTCYGKWCENVSQGLPNYIKTGNDSLNYSYSGEYISEDFYDDYISKGFWFTCPYSYSGSYFVIGSDLIDRLGGRDLLVPINCFISAYSAGRKMLFFGDPEYGAYWSGSLITGNTPGHQRLFMFFDIVLSFGLLVVLLKLFNSITGKK